MGSVSFRARGGRTGGVPTGDAVNSPESLTRPNTGNTASRTACLSRHYGLAKVNNFSLRERKIMRAQFTMTPKQVSNLQRKLKRERSPNRNTSLITKGFTQEDNKARMSTFERERFADAKQSTLVRK